MFPVNFKPLQENTNHIHVINNKLLKAQLLLVLIGIYKANRSYFIKWPIIWFDDNFITKLIIFKKKYWPGPLQHDLTEIDNYKQIIFLRTCFIKS